MNVIQVKHLHKQFGDKEVLKDIHFTIRKTDKIGLVGWNGTGKSTLVQLLTGALEPNQGTISKYPPTLSIGYLPQVTDADTTKKEINNRYLQTISQLRVHHVQNETYASGGERLKLALAEVWATNPEMLILDEPTNHLDVDGLRWLIKQINQFDGPVLMISHDRYFLDETVTLIFELEDGQLTIYEGNYSAYQAEKQRRRQQQSRDYTKQQRHIDQIEQQVSTLRQWSAKSHRDAGKGRTPSENKQMGLKEYERVKAKKKDNQIKSKLKRLELELSKNKIEKPKEDPSIYFSFEASRNRGKRIVEATNLTKTYGSHTLFSQSHFYIKHGEKVGLLGTNGAGKTTFIKMLLQHEEVTSGSLWKSDSLRIAYLNQDISNIPLEKNALEFIDITERTAIARARTLFANLGLKEEKLLTPLHTLSLGERTRVKLVSMIMMDYDLLILDEPTNHLDLPSREQLEKTLESYRGTLLIVSHDLYLIDKICDKLLVIENQRISRIESGLHEYEQSKKASHEPDKKSVIEELSLLDTKISELLGKISMALPGSPDYVELDHEITRLLQDKRKLQERIKG
ncbi:ribosomal protection-like ABC-F family protein [Bacillus alkalicellulosilyticus]|uniref:ribosomal protection-like ABC-F family protein n=1 Tax=Alkalihalobacterium alkalicellulosilyticum TaxID=1912214 RepID=UPI0009987D3D|nr:ABC-F type ribosomal protection protein [Bacillus alkalicellulosilyticus]